MNRHLISAGDLSRDDAVLILDTAEELASVGGAGDQEAAHAARPDRGQPLLRGLHADADLLRGGRQAAVRRRDQLLRQGVERRQGRVAQGHRADPGGDGRGRRGDQAPRLRRAAPADRTGSAAAWSTRATARTSTPPRRCSTPSPCGSGSSARRRRAARAASADRRGQGPRRPAGDDRRRRAALPGGALQRAAAVHPRRAGHRWSPRPPSCRTRSRRGRAGPATTSTPSCARATW